VSAFVDTGVLVAFSSIRDKNHAKAVELLQRAEQGEYGSVLSSDYVFDEMVTLALMLTKNPTIALGAGELLLGSPTKGVPSLAELLHVDDETFSNSWEFFKRYANRGLSFTGCTTVALMKRSKIDNLRVSTAVSMDRKTSVLSALRNRDLADFQPLPLRDIEKCFRDPLNFLPGKPIRVELEVLR
jgi:hypothetical protein